jgi:hypothetical protein
MADNLPPSCAECLEIWEPRPPGTLRADGPGSRDMLIIERCASSIPYGVLHTTETLNTEKPNVTGTTKAGMSEHCEGQRSKGFVAQWNKWVSGIILTKFINYVYKYLCFRFQISLAL